MLEGGCHKVAGYQESLLSREGVNIDVMSCLYCAAGHETNSTCFLPHLPWHLPRDQKQSEGVGRALG